MELTDEQKALVRQCLAAPDPAAAPSMQAGDAQIVMNNVAALLPYLAQILSKLILRP